MFSIVRAIFKIFKLQNSNFQKTVKLKKTYQEKVLNTVDDSIDRKNWFPVLAQNIQANITFKVNIWMVDLCCAFDLETFKNHDQKVKFSFQKF